MGGNASVVTWTLPDPVLTESVASPGLGPGSAAEPKWDGYRAQLARWSDGRVLLRSRQSADIPGVLPPLWSVALRQSGAKKTLLIMHVGLRRPATEWRALQRGLADHPRAT
ncbi:hypothetical protein GCM10023323_68220 [Streptomyces thinghirensis]|uniref:ATP-dependent DNA ligase family profile domain-containing protein n=1 Tax=Streptomyces thinghirensis TaxID=551547 RepID=A0ABP9THD2_9ACTN